MAKTSGAENRSRSPLSDSENGVHSLTAPHVKVTREDCVRQLFDLHNVAKRSGASAKET
jgi:hypothetical protein